MSVRTHGHGAAAASGRCAAGRARPRASVAMLVALAIGIVGCGPKASYSEDDPRSAVHQFLRASVGQSNGQRACALLTEAARERFARSAGSCRNALNAAVSALPGSASTGEGTGRAAEDIELEAATDGDRATVTAFRGDGPRLRFEVVRLSEDELERDTEDADQGVGSAPASDWRVDRGVEQLVTVTDRPPVPSPEPDGRG